MKPRRLGQEWKRASLSLLARVPVLLRACRRRATAEQVHELRVVLRRLRLLLRVGRPLAGEADVTAFIDWSRRICTAAGPLRDDDVAIEWLGNRKHAEPIGCQITKRRSKRTVVFRRRLVAMPGAMRRAMARVKDDAEQGQTLRKRFVKRVATLRRALEHGSPRFFRLGVEAQHEFRRCLRQWRYLREFDRALGREPGDPALKALTRLQEAIGEFQNLKIVEATLPRDRTAASRLLRRVLLKDQARWLARIQKRLHAATAGWR